MVTIHAHNKTTRRVTSTNANKLDRRGTLAGLEPIKGSPKAALRIALGVALVLGILLSGNAYAYAPTKALKSISPKDFAKSQLSLKEYKCIERLYTLESNWRTAAYNKSGAYGIPQLKNPIIKHMDGINQVRYGLKYLRARYHGSACSALHHFNTKGWH